MIVEVTELGQWFLNCGPRLPGDRESHLGLTVACVCFYLPTYIICNAKRVLKY